MRASVTGAGLICLAGAGQLCQSSAFLPSKGGHRYAVLKMTMASPEEDQAAALSDYLAKAHEEKLRAIREVEETKSAEIQALKEQIKDLKRSGGGGGGGGGAMTTSMGSLVAGGVDLLSLSKEDLVNKLFQYQDFMKEYIVNAQEQKLKAVHSAEATANKKWQDKLLLLEQGGDGGGEPTAPSPAPVAAVDSTSSIGSLQQSPLYEARNAAVSAAAAAGKSRWGDMEAQRATASLKAATASRPNVGAAVVNAAAVTSTGPISLQPSQLYAARNAAVSAAAAAGKSRWGGMETQRAAAAAAASLNAATAYKPNAGAAVVDGVVADTPAPTQAVPVPPEVATADHGLRADGGVGGLTLAERVAMGSSASNAGAAVIHSVVADTPAPTQAVPVPPEVAAADHGLRADGGVGGLTLAERVVMGASASTAATAAAATPARQEIQLSPNELLYRQRNLRLAAAAAAGQSRWGAMENNRVHELASSATYLPSNGAAATTKTMATTTTESSSAGSSSAGARVNLGAALLGYNGERG